MKHELLIPVGNYESLVAAINNGADAVYLGGKKFGARAFADNFNIEQIEEATKLCHLYGVKIYITVNTLVYEQEINEAFSYVKQLHQIGVDALIMQDIGLINLVHQSFPNLEIHASTQMHNHSKESINFLKKLGIKRIVFARELPLSYINNIETDLEKEVFIHGSLCISYSGQCLFSSFILNRSGNRGECAGMCRLPYKLIENDKEIKTNGDYLLSPKDLCSITNFKKLMESNIKCFKIEGRMKSPAYVAVVTKIYRSLMDQYEQGKELKVSKADLELLQAIFNREYTESHLFNDPNIMNFKAPNHQGLWIGKVTNVTKNKIAIKLEHDLKQFEGIRFMPNNIGITTNFLYDKNNNLVNRGKKGEVIYLDNFIHLKELNDVYLTNPLIEIEKNICKKIPIDITIKAQISKPLEIIVKDNENQIILNSTQVVEKSHNAPLLKERIAEAFSKVGNSPFKIASIKIVSDDNIFIPLKVLNELKRKALLELQNLRENKKTPYIEIPFIDTVKRQKVTTELNVLARTSEQIKALQDLNVKNIIVNNKKLMQDNFIYRIPRDNLNHNYSYSHLLVTDYASLDKYPNERSDYFLNITNHYSLNYISNYTKEICLSPENNLDNLKDIMDNYSANINVEFLIYGNIELMIMKYCPLKEILNTEKICHVCQNNNRYYLKDRNNKLYRIINNENFHSTTILNTNKTDLIDKISYLKEIGITNFRIELLDESYEEVKKLIERVKKYI